VKPAAVRQEGASWQRSPKTVRFSVEPSSPDRPKNAPRRGAPKSNHPAVAELRASRGARACHRSKLRLDGKLWR
ncbi:MAG: hypothetical protein ACREQJ_06290, partial [Candidatus Binatia bacterium]